MSGRIELPSVTRCAECGSAVSLEWRILAFPVAQGWCRCGSRVVSAMAPQECMPDLEKMLKEYLGNDSEVSYHEVKQSA